MNFLIWQRLAALKISVLEIANDIRSEPNYTNEMATNDLINLALEIQEVEADCAHELTKVKAAEE